MDGAGLARLRAKRQAGCGNGGNFACVRLPQGRLALQRLDAQGAVLETRGLRTSGFSTSLQLLDVDGDGQLDVVVLNSSGKRSVVIYGPLWERAMPRP